jgi:Uma2 family endonuclease
MSVTSSVVTADELLRMPRGEVRRELVNGELRTMSPAGAVHSIVSGNIIGLLYQFVKRHKLGVVFGSDPGFWMASNPDTVRAPDAAFLSSKRFRQSDVVPGFMRIMPDLLAEVISPSDVRREAEDKIAAWLEAGVRVTWLVDPPSRTIVVQRADGPAETLGMGDTLTEPDLLPGFSAAVADVFELS